MAHIGPKLSDLTQLAATFLRLGLTAFGGPAAHIAMMRAEFVSRRGWLTDEEFLDLVGASNLIPGPGSTEVAIYIGARRCGWMGLVLAGLCFILPAALIVMAIAHFYVRYGRLPEAQAVFHGMKPVIAAVVASAAVALAPKAWSRWQTRAIGVCATVLALLSINSLAILFGAGLLLAVASVGRQGEPNRKASFGAVAAVGAALVGVPLIIAAAGIGVVSATPGGLFIVFLKIGSALYGSGYVLLAFLLANLVDHLHWMSLSRIVDAVAVGQFTPGPVFTTATFIGYVLAGPWGAFAATVGIFLPAFALVAVSGPLIPRLRSDRVLSLFLDGVNAASIGLIASVTIALIRASVTDLSSAIVAVLSLAILIRTRVNSAWLMLLGAAYGLIAAHFGHGQ